MTSAKWVRVRIPYPVSIPIDWIGSHPLSASPGLGSSQSLGQRLPNLNTHGPNSHISLFIRNRNSSTYSLQ